ncbi:hypothetical protein [Flavobacterium sp.]|uniref:hypothetical protein n=1 Tax=Flavobacterium sp. TaxID=239 RepID=UPI002BADEF3E|nr:hypothetical protein [Flavobacterium sp.]HSD06986.1 hypothetical protein [Flavobacterium sp.]
MPLIVFSFYSCQNELIDSNEKAISQIKAIEVIDGRLAFESKDALTKIYVEYAEASNEKISNYLEPLYKQNFYSLRPIVTEKNEEFLYNYYKNKKEETQIFEKNNTQKSSNDLEYLDNSEKIIGDDTFAAFLNSDGEIQIANVIYKYTDVGLFYTAKNNFADLLLYLKNKNISTTLTKETALYVKEKFNTDFPKTGETPVNENVTLYKIAPIDPEDGGGGGAPYVPAPNSPVSTDPSYNAFLNNLSSCDPHSGIFGDLFGDNDVCIDQYEGHRRVKTKAFNYDYLLVYHMGIKVVHQFKGWTGLWRDEEADEIRLVLEAAQFTYDLDKLLGNTAINNQTKERAYFLNNQRIVYYPNTITVPNVVGPSTTYFNMTSLPPLFQDDLTFEFFSTGNSWLDGQIQNGIDSNLKATKLNAYFYNELYSTITSELRAATNNSSYNPPANRTFVAKFPENGKMVIQKSLVDKGAYLAVRQKTFDWGGEIAISASTSGSEGWKISGGAGNQLARPSNFRVKIIGAIYNNGGWHGSKFNTGID